MKQITRDGYWLIQEEVEEEEEEEEEATNKQKT